MQQSPSGPWIAVAFVAAISAATPAGWVPSALFSRDGDVAHDLQARLQAAEAIVDVLPGKGRDLIAVGAVRIAVDGERLATWARSVEQWQRGKYVTAVGEFSSPPQLHDLDGLTLSDDDLVSLRECEPGSCGLKLSAGEIGVLRQRIAAAGPLWKSAALAEFRRLMLMRVTGYLANGLRDAPPYADRTSAVSPADEFAVIASRPVPLMFGATAVLAYLADYPRAKVPGVQSVLYWSVESLGAGKPIVSITHTAIAPRRDGLDGGRVVASAQVFASHYLTGSLSLTAVAGTGDRSRYLVYFRHSRADVFDGAFRGVVRRVIQSRVRADAPAVLRQLRERLESGEPDELQEIEPDSDAGGQP